MTTSYDQEDHKRYWRDLRTIGFVGKETPIQSSFALLTDPDQCRENIKKLTSYQISRPLDRNNDKVDLTPCNSNNVLNNLFKDLPAMIDSHTHSNQEILDEMLLLSNSSFGNCMIPKDTTSSHSKSLKGNAIDLSKENGKNRKENGILSTETIDSISSKINPFESAKTKFVKEGGKLEHKTEIETIKKAKTTTGTGTGTEKEPSSTELDKEDLPPELQQFEKHLVEKIESDIIHSGQPISFADIAGLEFAKKTVQEIIVWPMTRPDLFKGLRSVPKGLLLFGPPGTGKTLIGKAISYEIGATFFSISASSLTSKWIGEGEKTVRTLFGVAVYRQPSIIFIDEIDSLLCQRSSEENEASRRMKTEFLIQIDGAGTSSDARVVLIGATNRPDELDDAARRRFVKKLYIPLPDDAGREQLIQTLLSGNHHSLSNEDIQSLVIRTTGYSGADIRSLCTEAAMGPVRDLAQSGTKLQNIRIDDVPPMCRSHFDLAFDCVLPSVSPSDLKKYLDWNNEYGSFRKME